MLFKKIRNEMYYLRNFNSLTFFVDFAPKYAQFLVLIYHCRSADVPAKTL